MYQAHTITHVLTTIALFLYCCLIAVPQAATEDKPKAETGITDTEDSLKDKPSTTDAQSALEGAESALKDKLPKPNAKSLFDILKDKVPFFEKLDAWTQSNDEDERAFDLSVTGDKITKNINFSTTIPINSLEGYFRGQSVLIRHNGKNISQSYMFQFDGNILGKLFNAITPRGHFEIENDPTLITDPHLHISLYDDFTLVPAWKWLKGGVGFWSEVVSERGMPINLEGKGELDPFSKFRGGLRCHLDLKGKHKWANFDMEIEYLQHLRFDKFECSVRTSPELKIEILENISLVIIGEIDFYYIDKGLLTIEPLVNIFKPFDTNWTHLWSIEF